MIAAQDFRSVNELGGRRIVPPVFCSGQAEWSGCSVRELVGSVADESLLVIPCLGCQDGGSFSGVAMGGGSVDGVIAAG